MSPATRAILHELKQIQERLQHMPTLADLQAAVDEVKVAVDAAADREINHTLEVPQGVLDELIVIKGKADSILPA